MLQHANFVINRKERAFTALSMSICIVRAFQMDGVTNVRSAILTMALNKT